MRALLSASSQRALSSDISTAAAAISVGPTSLLTMAAFNVEISLSN